MFKTQKYIRMKIRVTQNQSFSENGKNNERSRIIIIAMQGAV